jgi:hypothetical protein
MEEELSGSIRIVVEDGREHILGDPEVTKPDLPIPDVREGIGPGDPAILDRFDLGTQELDTALEGLLDCVIESGSAIDRDDFDTFGDAHRPTSAGRKPRKGVAAEGRKPPREAILKASALVPHDPPRTTRSAGIHGDVGARRAG